MDVYFDHIRNEFQFEHNPDDGTELTEPDLPTPEEVTAFWADVASDSWIPF